MSRLETKPQTIVIPTPKKSCIVPIFATAAVLALLLNVIIPSCVSFFNNRRTVTSESPVGDKLYYVLQNDMLSDLGYSETSASDFYLMEDARCAYSLRQQDKTYTYYIGNKSGRDNDLNGYFCSLFNVEEGRGLIIAAVDDMTIEITHYPGRNYYYIDLEKGDEQYTACITPDFEVYETSFADDCKQDLTDIIDLVGREKIEALMSDYHNHTENLLDSLIGCQN